MTAEDFEMVLKVGEHVGVEFKEAKGGANPIIEEGDQFVTIIPLNESYSADKVSSDDRVNDALTDEQKCLFLYIGANPGRNTEVIAGAMKKSVPTISRYIKELKELGKVEYSRSAENGGILCAERGLMED